MPHHVLAAGELEQPTLDVVVAHLDGLDDILDTDPEGRQLVRIDVDLVLLDEPANAGDFSHAGYRRQPVAEVPVLKAAQIRQAVPARFVHQCVFEHPADASGIRPDDRVGVFR